MKIRVGIIAFVMFSLVLLASSFSPRTIEQADASSWLPIVEGAVDFQKFIIDGPVRVHVARMYRNNPNVFIESSIAQGRLSGGFETVRGMAARYEQALNYWGPDGKEPAWGGRNRVVVAINGFFYDFDTGIPTSGQVHSSWFSKYYEVNGEAEGFVWKTNGQAFIGECITQNIVDQTVTVFPAGNPSGIQVQINGLNRDRNGNELILFTPQYNTNTLTPGKKNSVEVLVEMQGPTRLLQGGEGVLGTIKDIRVSLGSTALPFDHVVLSAHGLKEDVLLATGMAVGDQVEITQKITVNPNCANPPTIGWGLAYAGIGGYPVLLRDGEIPSFTDPNGAVNNPRTAVAFNEEYIYFVVVDGRNPGVSIGMTYVELATFLRDTLEADWAINQDGGGSSTLVINGQVMNNTTGNDMRCLEPPDPPDPPPTPSPQGPNSIFIPSVRKCNFYERAVANGLMMVAYEPMNVSAAYPSGQAISTSADTTVRLGPGTNFGAITTLGPGTLGVIVDHPNGLNGVQAKDQFWWKAAFGGTVGWVPEANIVPIVQTTPGAEPISLQSPSLPEE